MACCRLSLRLMMSLAGCLVFAQSAKSGDRLIDPQIYHTNRMPIASSEPHRNGSVCWTCNPDHWGYCGGCYKRILLAPRGDRSQCNCESMRAVACCPNCQRQIWQSQPSQIGFDTSIDGLEGADNVMLGEIPAIDPESTRRTEGVPPPPTSPGRSLYPFPLPDFGGS